MVLVKPGIFIMGHNQGGLGNEPEHLVEITQPFYMGKYPVTQQIWKTVMQKHNPSRFKGDQRPVEQVSWQDIVQGGQDYRVPVAFLDQLNQKHASTKLGYAFRLPTEAEWEYAAKGGDKSALTAAQVQLFIENGKSQPPFWSRLLLLAAQVQSFLANGKRKVTKLYKSYAGSDQLKEVGWYDFNSHRETKEVGLRKPNELGIFDMSGNVYEWCQDWYDSGFYEQCKRKGIVKDPVNKNVERHRARRGGSWFHSHDNCMVFNRFRWIPSPRHSTIGFRLVLAPVR